MEEMDSEILLKSMIYMAEGVASIIGDNGARAAMRQAGHSAAVNLLEALPLELPVDQAVMRAGPIMQALGFVGEIELKDANHFAIRDNAIAQMLDSLHLVNVRHPARYYLFGLLEGFVHVLSKARISVVQCEVVDNCELWTIHLPQDQLTPGSPSPTTFVVSAPTSAQA